MLRDKVGQWVQLDIRGKLMSAQGRIIAIVSRAMASNYRAPASLSRRTMSWYPELDARLNVVSPLSSLALMSAL
jgi:hypothetical protein